MITLALMGDVMLGRRVAEALNYHMGPEEPWGGVLNLKTRIKLTWGVIMAALAVALLLAGGGGPDALSELTNGAILAATPFGILMVPMCYGLFKILRTDFREERQQLQEAMAYDRQVEIRQMQEIMHPPPRSLRHVRVPDRPPSNLDE